MGQQSWNAADFQGLTPGIDPRRSDKFFVLNGRNYIFDSLGPRSAFGDRYVTPYAIQIPAHAQGFRLSFQGAYASRAFQFFGDGMFEWKESLGNWQLIYVTSDTTIQPHRWTQAYLNGEQFFCHPAVGILVYNVNTGRCTKYADAPTREPVAICENNGRLCIMDYEFTYWSAQSNGRDFEPRLGGAGFQKISDRVSGDPIMLTSYTAGILTWTSGGVMRSEFTGDQAVYRHRALTTKIAPANSFCCAQTGEDTVIILDRRGLFQTKGEAPTPYAPLFNEFLIRYIQDNHLDEGQNLRIEWDELQRLMYVSVSSSYDSPIYEQAFVLYPPLDKWGQFNEPHFGILPFRFESGSRKGDAYGFVDAAGRCRFWRKAGNREAFPSSGILNSYAPAVQKPGFTDSSGAATVLSSAAATSAFPPSNAAGFAGFFSADGGVNSIPRTVGLSARIQLGLLRFETGETIDQMVEVNQLVLGNSVADSPEVIAGEYSLDPVQSTESLSLENEFYTNHGLRIIGTVDGKSEFLSQVPSLTLITKAGRHYSCSVPGMWHVIELTATEPGEAFHLHSLGLTGSYAGKLA